MDWSTLFQWLAAGASAAAAAYLAWRYLFPPQPKSSPSAKSQGDGGSSSASSDADGQVNQEPSQPDHSDLAREISENPNADALKEALEQKTGISLRNRGDIERALNDLPKDVLQALRLALGTKRLVDLDLQSRRRKQMSVAPADRIQQRLVNTVDELIYVDPVEMVDDDQLVYRFINDELYRPQWYKWVEELKAAEVLIDISGSMSDRMASGHPRYVVAMAIAVQLLLEAQKGGAKYYIRTFDDKVFPVMKATNRSESKDVISHIFNMSFNGGGTDIMRAVGTAVNDMGKDVGKQLATKSIVLITDAQDGNVTYENLVKTLGDCKLHVVVLGLQSDVMKMAAESYLSLP